MYRDNEREISAKSINGSSVGRIEKTRGVYTFVKKLPDHLI